MWNSNLKCIHGIRSLFTSAIQPSIHHWLYQESVVRICQITLDSSDTNGHLQWSTGALTLATVFSLGVHYSAKLDNIHSNHYKEQLLLLRAIIYHRVNTRGNTPFIALIIYSCYLMHRTRKFHFNGAISLNPSLLT